MWREIRSAIGELKSYPPKTVVRGKFEAWFLVEYMKALLARLNEEARKIKATISVNPPVEHGSLVALAAPTIDTPSDLETFFTSAL
jgi:hypothetical protein